MGGERRTRIRYFRPGVIGFICTVWDKYVFVDSLLNGMVGFLVLNNTICKLL